MTLLYPRLLRHRAKLLAAEYKERGALDLNNSWALTDETAVFVATGGTRVEPEKLQVLRDMVVDLAKESGFPQLPDAKQKTAFDLRLAVALHREMRISPAEAASGDVWAFLALIVLPDVAHWRYPKPPGDRVLASDLTRHVFGRLWWRAQLVYTPADFDPYAALHVLGEAAFDQIYARRAALGGSPHLIKSILRVWKQMDLTGLAEREILRDFLKRLLRLAPFVVFEALDSQSLDEELTEVARETIRGAVGGESTEENINRYFRAVREDNSGSISPGTQVCGIDFPVSNSNTSRDFKPYRAYDGVTIIGLSEDNLRAIADVIVRVVQLEGPVAAVRVYRLISSRPGRRVSENMRTTMVAATRLAIADRLILVEGRVGTHNFDQAVLRTAEQGAIVVRERGVRNLEEIPGREISEAFRLLRVQFPNLGADEVITELSRIYGFDRCSRSFYGTVRKFIDRYSE